MPINIMFEDNNHFSMEEAARRCSLPTLRSSFGAKDIDVLEEQTSRRLPPLPQIEPLPPGPFNPFTPSILAPSPPCSQDSFSVKSSWAGSESLISPPSPASSVEFSLKENFSTQKAFGWPNDLSYAEIMSLVAPRNINRKPPLQQLCGRKRRNSLVAMDQDDQREKHRIAEGNRRKNLSQLHRELDSRVHDFFLERAGWNPAKSLPQSKEHIIQGAIFLIDFMLVLLTHLLSQDKHISAQLTEDLQSHLRCMQLQQTVCNLQQQNQDSQQQVSILKKERDAFADRNRALEFQLKSYEHMFRSSPKNEASSSLPPGTIPQTCPKNVLPGMRVFCGEVAAIDPAAGSLQSGGPVRSFGNQPFHSTPPTTGPPSPAYIPTSQFSTPGSRRESLHLVNDKLISADMHRQE